MTPTELRALIDEVKKLNAEATKGPWYVILEDTYPTVWLDRKKGLTPSMCDLNLVDRYRSACPQLATECEKLMKQVEIAILALKKSAQPQMSDLYPEGSWAAKEALEKISALEAENE